MSDFLKTMAASSRARADAVGRRFTDDELDRPVFPLELRGFDLIAEIKNRSPAEGELSVGAGDHAGRARQYVTGGAAAISVLTEPDRFDGELSHLEAVVDAVAKDAVPVMRKDFLVDPVQVLEARAAGARITTVPSMRAGMVRRIGFAPSLMEGLSGPSTIPARHGWSSGSPTDPCSFLPSRKD